MADAAGMTTRHDRSAPRTERHAALALLALSIAGLVVSVVQTLVLPLLPEFMRAFHTSLSSVTWIFTATLLASAVATPLLSRFGDMYGKKKMILAGLVMLVAGSLVCALSGSLAVLITGRAMQGVSSALIPLAIGVIRDTFPRERVMTAIGIVSATLGVGGGLGMLVTGIIAEHTTSYRPVFWISTAVGALGLVLVAALIPDTGQRSPARPDLAGAGLLAGWLVCLLLALTEGPAWGWTSGGTVGLFAGGVAGCALWTVVELRIREPLVRLSLLAGPRSLSANVASLLLGFAMYAAFTLFTNLVQTPRAQLGYGLSGSVLDVGLYLLPSIIGTLVFSALAGQVERRIGAAYALAAGALFVGIGLAWLAVSSSHVSDMLISSAFQGIGFGIGYAALGTLAVQHVPMDSSAIASGINSLVRTRQHRRGDHRLDPHQRRHRPDRRADAARVRDQLRDPGRRRRAGLGGRGHQRPAVRITLPAAHRARRGHVLTHPRTDELTSRPVRPRTGSPRTVPRPGTGSRTGTRAGAPPGQSAR